MSSDYQYQETVTLPSKGLLYPKEDCPTGDITMRAMTTGDESLTHGVTKDNVDVRMNRMIHGCILNGWNTDFGRMAMADRMFLLYRLRIITYGGEYKFAVECPKCGEESTYRIDLDKLPVTSLHEGWAEPFMVSLPISKRSIGWRYLRVDDEAGARSYRKQHKQRGGQSDPTLVFQFARRIVSVDGDEDIPFEQLFTFINKMHAADSRYWENNIKHHSIGIETDIEVTCRECGKSHVLDLPVDDDFFRPALVGERELSPVFASGVNVAYNPNETSTGSGNGDASSDEGISGSGVREDDGRPEEVKGGSNGSEEHNGAGIAKPEAPGTPGNQVIFEE